MQTIHTFIDLLEQLERKNIFYKLDKIREGAIMIEAAIPGERWEIEFDTFGSKDHCDIVIEKFVSNGEIYDESELAVLFEKHSE